MSQVNIYVKLWDLVWAPMSGRDHDKFSQHLSYNLKSEWGQGTLMRSSSGHLIGVATIHDSEDLLNSVKSVISALSETYSLSPYHPRDIEVVMRKNSHYEYLWITDLKEMRYNYYYYYDEVGESAAQDFFA